MKKQFNGKPRDWFMTKQTAGWGWCIADVRFVIARLTGRNKKQKLAYGHLITLTPELYEWLKWSLHVIEKNDLHEGYGQEAYKHVLSLIEEAEEQLKIIKNPFGN